MKIPSKILAALIALTVLPFALAQAEDLTISDIMKKAHKGGLLKRVQAPDASDADKKQLLEFYEALAKLDPPKGDKSEWAERTKAMVDAAALAVDDDKSKLKRAVNCRDCHTYHKP